ncbi:MAG: MCP four helix bundle domain-containing protein, partial [Nitrospirae bacterium]|nr:MCP four helix bundle domain-containing protein [Nitrospirota bacterium]
MKWFYDLKVRTKLLTGFVLVALFTVIVGIIGIRASNNINDMADEMYAEAVLPLETLGNVTDYFQRLRVYTRDFIYSNNADEEKKLLDEIKTQKEEIHKEMEKYFKTIHTEEGKQIYKEALDGLKEYDSGLDKVIELNAAKKDAEAHAYLKKELAPVGKKIGDALDKLTDRNVANGKRLSDETTVLYKSSFRLILIGSIVCFIISILTGIFIARTVTKPLGGEPGEMSAMAMKIATGDLNIEADAKASKDNLLGAMLSMVNILKGIFTEIDKLINSVKDGNLAVRGESEKYQGGWRQLIDGLNTLVEAFVKPINLTSEYVEKISTGDIPSKITDDYRGDFNKIKNNLNVLIDAENNITNIAEELSGGNLMVKVAERSEKDRLMQSISTMVQRLTEVVLEVQRASEQVASGSQQLSATTEELSQGASEQAASAEEISSSMEQMSANIKANADNAMQTEKMASKSAVNAKESGESVEMTAKAMKEIAEKIMII